MEKALIAAADYYREAAKLREGQDRIMTLKALAQTHANAFTYDLPCDREEGADSAREALEFIDQEQDPAVYFETLNYRKILAGEEEDASEEVPENWLEGSIDQSVNQLGIEKTVQLIRYAYGSIKDYPRLLRMQLDAEPLFKNGAFEHIYHFEVIRTFVRTCGVETYDFENPPDETVDALAESAMSAAKEESNILNLRLDVQLEVVVRNKRLDARDKIRELQPASQGGHVAADEVSLRRVVVMRPPRHASARRRYPRLTELPLGHARSPEHGLTTKYRCSPSPHSSLACSPRDSTARSRSVERPPTTLRTGEKPVRERSASSSARPV